ncbi:hypothetical protein M0M57_02020 [Flavobacterium azooxidireducens]|uniref:DUF4238 domain-containing protein n=1 Tax=Flavobacterium azooxidireducens TaxID=1871076 RepID=A0ABY4KJP0_9FLAO|nr:hypothetical protein [Flavobacterium azooxidireducens]UPQ79627.1 hypothetical protein M0M57_02020 [Flavobacterium azooxidireducens]
MNHSTKKNSHIFPKFLSTIFLGAKGTSRKGYDLSSENILKKKPRVIQDSIKEDYILCEDCEAYFGVIEGISTDTFLNWKQKVITGEYLLKKIIDDLELLECVTADKKNIFLLIYSIFWRASISEDIFFKNFKIISEFEEELRIILLAHKSIKKTEYLENLKKIADFKIFPVSIMTAKSFTNNTANMLFAPSSIDPYSLIVDQFSFLLFRTSEEIIEFVKGFSNIKIDDCRIMVYSEKLWHFTIMEKPIEVFVKQATKGK